MKETTAFMLFICGIEKSDVVIIFKLMVDLI